MSTERECCRTPVGRRGSPEERDEDGFAWATLIAEDDDDLSFAKGPEYLPHGWTHGHGRHAEAASALIDHRINAFIPLALRDRDKGLGNMEFEPGEEELPRTEVGGHEDGAMPACESFPEYLDVARMDPGPENIGGLPPAHSISSIARP